MREDVFALEIVDSVRQVEYHFFLTSCERGLAGLFEALRLLRPIRGLAGSGWIRRAFERSKWFPDFMNSSELSRYPVFHLRIGECFLTKTPTVVCTVLGSCVAVTFFQPKIGIGGIFHALLPDSAGYSAEDAAQTCRFVSSSIQSLLLAVQRHGGRVKDLQVKVFGGAELFGFGSGLSSCNNSVGRKNVQVAIMELEKAGLRILASDVGGELGRKLYFLTSTGEIWVKRIKRTIFPQEA